MPSPGLMSGVAPADLTLMMMAIIAALSSGLQLLRIDRLAREFEDYAAKNDACPVDVVQAIMHPGELDKHQKILRTESIFTAGLMALTLSCLLAIIVIAW